MSKMNDMSIDHDGYEQYIESMNQEMRREGAEEFRIEVLRAIETQLEGVSDVAGIKLGLSLAHDIVTRSNI